MRNATDPVVIGGSGGSGTRVVAMACLGAGYDLGTHLNESYDALDFAKFYDDWVNPYLLMQESTMHPGQLEEMHRAFDECLSRFRSSINDSRRWGWKNPRSMIMLPFIDSLFPGMKFIHVVRDGRDMAYSKNQNQLRKHGAAMLQGEEEGLSSPLQSIAFWNKANIFVASYGEEVMRERYFCCRFEDWCFDPKGSLQRLAEFLDARIENPGEITDELTIPQSIGRWRKAAAEEQAELTETGHIGLDYFRYLGASTRESGFETEAADDQ